MFVEHLTLTNFRNYEEADVSFTHGTTALLGANGQGKTSLAEALTYLATLDSFRGVPTETLIRNGADTAILRATVKHPDNNIKQKNPLTPSSVRFPLHPPPKSCAVPVSKSL